MSSQHSPADHATRDGVIATASAFCIWGLLPLYLKPLNGISALQISAWRSLMGCVFVFSWLARRSEIDQAMQALRTAALRNRLALTSSLLAVNWGLYAWGVAHGHVLTTSLGYFINPLVNVLLGVLILSERLNRIQWLAVAIACAGVVALTIINGSPPWIALVLAVTFSCYGFVRKTTPVAPLPGLAVETLLMAPLSLLYLLWFNEQTRAAIHTPLTTTLLLLSGVVTVVPLALFNYGARRINYVTVGMLQYIGPTLQFLVGIFIYRETLSPARLACFSMIWLALIVYAADGLWRNRANRS